MAEFTIKENDTAPSMRARLVDASQKPIPLSGATVVFNMRPRVQGGTATPIINGAVTILDEAKADVEYLWQAGDTAIPGLYEAEFQITFGDGSIETVPNDGYIDVTILGEVA